MRKRSWVLLVCGLAVLIFGAGIAGVLAYRQVHVQPVPAVDEEPRQVAESFLREAAKGDPTAACTWVVDTGGVLNPCSEDLEKRASFKALSQLAVDVRVDRIHVEGRSATVTSADLIPEPRRLLVVGLVLTDRDGMWVVRSLDGKSIKHEWTDQEWADQGR